MQDQTILQSSARGILSDLISDFEMDCDIEGVSLGDYYQESQELPSVWESNDFADSMFQNIDLMVQMMDYKNFQEWFFDHYDNELAPEWVKNWTKDMADTYYKTLKDMGY